MNSRFIHFALQRWKEKQLSQADLSFWQEILQNYPDTDPSQIVFLRNLLPTSVEAEQWLKKSFPVDPSNFLQRNSDGEIWFDNKQLSGPLLNEWNGKLILSEDAKIHRRFLRKSYQEGPESNLPAIAATLAYLELNYPMTKRAARFLTRWRKELEQSDSQKPRKFRFPWRPLVLGLALAGLVIFLIYVIANRPKLENTVEQPQEAPSNPPLRVPPESDVPKDPVVTVSKRSYSVKVGDVLWKIAQDQLGSAARWPDIYRLNQSLLPNPDYLLPGWELVLPEIQGTSQ